MPGRGGNLLFWEALLSRSKEASNSTFPAVIYTTAYGNEADKLSTLLPFPSASAALLPSFVNENGSLEDLGRTVLIQQQ